MIPRDADDEVPGRPRYQTNWASALRLLSDAYDLDTQARVHRLSADGEAVRAEAMAAQDRYKRAAAARRAA